MKNYIITSNAVIIQMEKPLFGTKYYIRDTYIKIAKKRHLTLVVKTPDGTMTCTPTEWMKGADRMEKVFNFPDNPMILFGKHIKMEVVKRDERKKQENKEKKIETSFFDMFSKMPEDKRAKLRAKLGLR